MNKTQVAIIQHIRAEIEADATKGALKSAGAFFLGQTDAKIARMLFQNYRLSGDRGLRLTNQGYAIIQHFFDFIEVKREVSKDTKGQSTNVELLYLDNNCKMPYFYSADRVALFDLALGLKIKLVEGDIASLARAEDFHA